MQNNRVSATPLVLLFVIGACAGPDDQLASMFDDARADAAEITDAAARDTAELNIEPPRTTSTLEPAFEQSARLMLHEEMRVDTVADALPPTDALPATTDALPATTDALPPTEAASRPVVQDLEDGFEVAGLPAISASGTVIAMRTWDDDTGEDAVTFFSGRTGRMLRAYSLSQEGAAGQQVARVLSRRLKRGGFTSLVAVEADPMTVNDAGYGAVFPLGQLSFLQQADRLIVRGADGVVGHTRVRARRPDGRGLRLMDPEMTEVPVVAEMSAAYRSVDGRHVVGVLSACDCACDINPYPLRVTLAR